MAEIVEYDPTGVVTDMIINYFASVNTPDYQTGNYLINPDLSALGSVPQKYWKKSGTSVIEMTVGEKADVDDEIDEADEASSGLDKFHIRMRKFFKMRRRLVRKKNDWGMVVADVRNFFLDMCNSANNPFTKYQTGYDAALKNFIDGYDTTNALFTQAIQNILIGIIEL